jgi:hypothetical protein
MKIGPKFCDFKQDGEREENNAHERYIPDASIDQS